MTQRMMRLFNNVTEARTFIKNDQGISLAKAKLYVEKNTVNKVDNKVWVILP
jgi:hypothetical protein